MVAAATHLILTSKGGPRTVSIKRIDATWHYEPGNVALICSGLNARDVGSHCNKNLTPEEQQVACRNGSFSVEAWRNALSYTADEIKEMERLRKEDAAWMRATYEKSLATTTQPQPLRLNVRVPDAHTTQPLRLNVRIPDAS